jgi:hypothetical protein
MRKKITFQEAMEILDISNMNYANMNMTFLIWEVPLTETSKFFKKGVYLFEDEVLALRDSANENLQIVRRNKELPPKKKKVWIEEKTNGE